MFDKFLGHTVLYRFEGFTYPGVVTEVVDSMSSKCNITLIPGPTIPTCGIYVTATYHHNGAEGTYKEVE